MQSKASLKFARIAPRKARVIANLVRGRDVADALEILKFTPKRGARVMEKLLASAIANARQKNVDIDELVVTRATVDKAPNKWFRRWRPRAMGRATQVVKGISHIDIELGLPGVRGNK